MINAGALVLKRWELAWAEELTAAVRESLPELKPFLPWAADDYELASARAYLADSDQRWEKGTDFQYAVFTTIGDLIGSIGLHTRRGPDTMEIGYWLRTPFAGRGHTTAAVRTLTRVVSALPGITKVAIVHDVRNLASGRVAEKAGFTEAARRVTEAGDTEIIRERPAGDC
ncbi:hypothetical protein GCM10009828_097000 [Actinoplanes couchii]